MGAEHAPEHPHGLARFLGPTVNREPERIIGPAVSLLIHIVLMVIAAIIIIRPAPRGITGTEVEIEFATDVQDDQPLDDPFDALETPLEASLQPLTDALDPSAEMFLADVPAETLDFTASQPVETLQGAGEGVGESGLTGSGMGGGTSFFGIEGRGNRFIYIVDISGSMVIDDRLSTLKRNLISSINELPAHAQFYIIAYSDGPRPMANAYEWYRATDSAKVAVSDWIRRLDSSGGTQPATSFERSFTFKPLPDVIFFMTDGQDIEGLPEFVNQLNSRGRKTKINTISFGDSGSEEMMRQIARESGGQYRYVP